MNQSTSTSEGGPGPPPIQFQLPPLSLSLFDAEPSSHQETNGVVHGSTARSSFEPSSPSSSGSMIDETVHHEIEEKMSIHDSPTRASWFPGERNLDEVCNAHFISNFFITKLAFTFSLLTVLSPADSDY